MNNWTEADYRRLQAKKDDTEPESVLQSKIVAYCKGRGFPCLSFRKSRKAKGFLLKGWCDVTILFPKGRVVFLELKKPKEVLKKEQAELMQQALCLGHRWEKVTTFKRFLEIAEDG